MNPLRRLAGQTAIYGLSSIIGRLLNYLLVPLYTRVLITSEYGIYTEMYAYVSILWVILTYGMETTFFRFSQSETDKTDVYSTSLLSLIFTSGVFLIISLIYAQPIAVWLGYPNNVNYVVWFVFILAFDAISAIPFAKLRQDNRPMKFAILKLINIGSNIGLNLFFILLCPFILKTYPDTNLASFVKSFFNPDDLVSYIFVSNLISTTLTLILQLPDFPWKKYSFNFHLWKKMLVYTWPLLVVSVAGSINLSLDKILLAKLLPSGTDVMGQVGIYGACYKVSIIMTLFVQTFRYAADPFFFNESAQVGARQLYADVLTLFMIAVSTIFLLTMMHIDIVILFIGTAYREGKAVIPLLLLGNLFLGVFYNFSIWYKLTNKTIYGAALSIIGATITIILNILLIPSMGYYGSAWAAFFAYFTMMTLSYILGQRHFKIPYNLKRLIFYPLLAIALYFASELLKPESKLLHLTINTILTAGYLFIVVKLDKKLLFDVLKKN
ncbi:MAG: oligosaccharide flippase family protein [Bacteroidales bacterium]